MEYRHADAISTLPILGFFIAKVGEEVGWGKLIVGALLTFILTGIAWNLNCMATDIRELRASIKEEVVAGLKRGKENSEKIERVEARQLEVIKRNEEQDRRIENIEQYLIKNGKVMR